MKLSEDVILKAFNGKLARETLEYALRISELILEENSHLSQVGEAKREMEKIELDMRILVADSVDPEKNNKPLFPNEQRREDEVKLRLRSDENHSKAFEKMRENLNALVAIRAEMEYLKSILDISKLYDNKVRKVI